MKKHRCPRCKNEVNRLYPTPLLPQRFWQEPKNAFAVCACCKQDWELLSNGFQKKHKRHYAENVCLQLWEHPWVTWSGDVLGCCWTQEGFGGNAVTDGYLAAVNSEKIRYARKMLRGEAEPRDDIPCTSCAIYKERRRYGAFVTRRETVTPRWYRAARFVYRKSGLKRLRAHSAPRRFLSRVSAS